MGDSLAGQWGLRGGDGAGSQRLPASLGSGVPRGLKPESIKLYLIEGRYGDRGLLQIELTAFRRDDDLFRRLAKGCRRAELYSGKNSR